MRTQTWPKITFALNMMRKWELMQSASCSPASSNATTKAKICNTNWIALMFNRQVVLSDEFSFNNLRDVYPEIIIALKFSSSLPAKDMLPKYYSNFQKLLFVLYFHSSCPLSTQLTALSLILIFANWISTSTVQHLKLKITEWSYVR